MSINITLDTHFKLQSDSRQFILVEDDRAIGFFQDLEGLVKSYFKRKILDSDAKTISQLLEYHKIVLNSLQQALAPLDIRVEGGNSQVRPKDLKGGKNE